MWVTFNIDSKSLKILYFQAVTCKAMQRRISLDTSTRPSWSNWSSWSYRRRRNISGGSQLRSVKVEGRFTAFSFKEMMLKPCPRISEDILASASDTTLMFPALQLQQLQIFQQNELMQAVLASLKEKKQRLETVKPNMFDGYSSGPEAWIGFYVYTSKNCWTVQHALFVDKRRKEVIDLHLAAHPIAI